MTLRTLLFLLTVLLLTSCGPKTPTLRILTFADYISPEVLASFEREFQCKVLLDGFNSGDALMSKLAAGGTAIYDLITPGNGEVPGFVALGLLAPLRHENIPNLQNLDTNLTTQGADAKFEFSVPYSWFTVGIFARRPKQGVLDESWGLLFDPARQQGSFLLVDESRTQIGIGLRYKGYSVNSTNSQELAEVREMLIEAKKRSLGLGAPTALANRVLTREAELAVGFNGSPAETDLEPECYFFIPREGSYIAIDSFAIPAKALNRDLAEKFINYLLDGRIAATNAAKLRISTPVRAAWEFLPSSIRTNQALFPPAQVMQRLEMMKSIGPNAKLYDEIWTQVKAR